MTPAGDGVGYYPGDGEASPLDPFLAWLCGVCGLVMFWAPRCPVCRAPTPVEIGGEGHVP